MTSTDELGPNIEEAKTQLNGEFKQEFLNVVLPTVDPKYHEKVKTIINESIDEGVDEVYQQSYSNYQSKTPASQGAYPNQFKPTPPDIEFNAYKPYSKMGWATWGMRELSEAFMRIYSNKLNEAWPEMVAAAEREEREAAADKFKIRGGRRKKHRKIKGKYTFKKRKSIRKKKKRRTRKL